MWDSQIFIQNLSFSIELNDICHMVSVIAIQLKNLRSTQSEYLISERNSSSNDC